MPAIEALPAKAAEKLRVAGLLLREDAWDDAASRAHYAAFHAISALHLSHGNSFSSHAQSIGRFNRDFVQPGTFPREFTAIVTRLFEDRQNADYDVAGTITREEARQDVADAGEILAAIQKHLT